jgi:hypothetical protein
LRSLNICETKYTANKTDERLCSALAEGWTFAPGSKNKEVAAGMDVDKPVASGWQTGVSALTEASEPSNLPATGEKAVVAHLVKVETSHQSEEGHIGSF